MSRPDAEIGRGALCLSNVARGLAAGTSLEAGLRRPGRPVPSRWGGRISVARPEADRDPERVGQTAASPSWQHGMANGCPWG